MNKTKQRYKSIDIVRGLSMLIMIFGHMLDWWLTEMDHWFFVFIAGYLEPIAASGFVFISGTSTILSYNNSISKPEASDKLYMQKLRNAYIIRALLILLTSFFYNFGVAIMYKDFNLLWSWNILQTLGFALLLSWILLKTSKIFRVIVCIIVLIINEFLFLSLIGYQGEPNFYGVIYHLLYNPVQLYPILPFFTSFILGTIIGDIMYEFNKLENEEERKSTIVKKLVIPTFLIGILLTIFGIVYLFPSFLLWYTISARLYAIGIVLMLISFLIGMEENNMFNAKNKRYRFFFFYSYYSFTIYLAHNPLYFLFYRQLNLYTFWIAFGISMFLITILLKIIYDKFGKYASLNVGISFLGSYYATKIYNKKLIKKNAIG